MTFNVANLHIRQGSSAFRWLTVNASSTDASEFVPGAGIVSLDDVVEGMEGLRVSNRFSQIENLGSTFEETFQSQRQHETDPAHVVRPDRR